MEFITKKQTAALMQFADQKHARMWCRNIWLKPDGRLIVSDGFSYAVVNTAFRSGSEETVSINSAVSTLPDWKIEGDVASGSNGVTIPNAWKVGNWQLPNLDRMFDGLETANAGVVLNDKTGLNSMIMGRIAKTIDAFKDLGLMKGYDGKVNKYAPEMVFWQNPDETLNVENKPVVITSSVCPDLVCGLMVYKLRNPKFPSWAIPEPEAAIIEKAA